MVINRLNTVISLKKTNKKEYLHMKQLTFDTFYSISQGQTIAFEELVANPLAYYHDIFCPICKKAQLHYNAGSADRSSHLKKNPSSSHDSSCPYNFTPVSTKVAKTMFKELSQTQIDSKLHAKLRQLEYHNLFNAATTAQDITDDNLHYPMPITHNAKNYALPTKSIAKIHQDKVMNQPYIFYGKVTLSTTEQPSKYASGTPYYFLKVSSVQNDNTVSIYRKGFKDQVIEGGTYYIAFIGYFTQEKQKEKFHFLDGEKQFIQYKLCE